MGCQQEELDTQELKDVDWSQLNELSHKAKFGGKIRIGNELAGEKHSPSLHCGVNEG